MYRHMKHSCIIRKYNDVEKEEAHNRLLILEETNKKQIETLKCENILLKKL